MLQCKYCKRRSLNYSMFVIIKEIKPKGEPNRTEKIGHCCDDCHDAGKPILIKYRNNNGET